MAMLKDKISFKKLVPSWLVTSYLEEPSPRLGFYWCVSLSLSIFCFFIFSVFATFPVIVSGEGKLTHRTPAIRIILPISIQVKKLNVLKGSEVKAGDTLLEATGHLTSKDITSLRTSLKELSEKIKNSKKIGCDHLCSLSITRILEQGIKPYLKQEIASSLSELITIGRKFTSNIEENIDKNAKLNDFQKREKSLKYTLQELIDSPLKKNLKFEIEQIRSKLSDLQNQMRSLDTTIDLSGNTIADLVEIKINECTNSLMDVEKYQNIKSPIEGTVVQLNVSGPGDSLEKGSTVLEIVPKNSDFYAEIAISSNNIALIETGQKAYIQIHAFQFSSNPLREGKVAKISPVATTLENGLSSQFPIAINIKSEESDLKSQNMRAGMTLTAAIEIAEEPFLQTIYRFLIGIKYSLKKSGTSPQ